MDYPAASLSELVSFLDSQDEPSIVMDEGYRILAANRDYAAAFGRMFSDSFAGIAPASAPAFMLAEVLGAGLGLLLHCALGRPDCE